MPPKLLLITYYWPPSGGPGVQRWLKMTKYLAEVGCDITVLTVKEEDASYPQRDESLLDEVHAQIRVLRTRAFNPYKLLSKDAGQGAIASASDTGKKYTQKWRSILPVLRSHLFIPDPRKGWNRSAYRTAKELLTSGHFDAVLTSSPPHSTQLIGYRLKKSLGVRWIMDMRDPWTDIFYYERLGHSALSAAVDRSMEMKCLESADEVMVVGNQMKTMVEEKLGVEPGKESSSVHVVTNGFDEADFKGLESDSVSSSGFHIAYTGTLSAFYNYGVMFDVIRECAALHPEVVCTIYGAISEDIQHDLSSLWRGIQFCSEVSHREINQIQRRADLLLLVIPEVANDGLILTGKLFEYLRSGAPIMNLGPTDGDAAHIVTACKAGQTFDRSQKEAMKAFLLQQIESKTEQRSVASERSKAVAEYSRENLANKVLQIVG